MPTLQGLMVSLKLDSRGYTEGLKKAQRDLDATDSKSQKLDKSTKSLGTSFGAMAKSLAKVGAVALAASYGITRLAESAAKEQRTMKTFSSMAASFGQSSQEMMVGLQRASQGTLSANEAAASATKLMSMGLATTSAEVERLTGLAITLGMAMGMGPQESFESFTQLLANQSTRSLREFGLSAVNVRDRMKDLQNANAGLGNDAAFVNAVLAEGAVVMGRLGDNAGGADVEFARMRASIEEVKDEIGLGLLPQISGAVEWVTRLAGAIVAMPEETRNSFLQMGELVLGLAAVWMALGGQVMVYIGLILAAAAALKTVADLADLSVSTPTDPTEFFGMGAEGAMMPQVSQAKARAAGPIDIKAMYLKNLASLPGDIAVILGNVVTATIPGLDEVEAQMKTMKEGYFNKQGAKGWLQDELLGTLPLIKDQTASIEAQAAALARVTPEYATWVAGLSGQGEIEQNIGIFERLLALEKAHLIPLREGSDEYELQKAKVEGVGNQLELLELRYKALGMSASQAGAATSDAMTGMSSDIIAALVATNPVVLMLKGSIASLQSQAEGMELQQRGLQRSISQASRAVQEQSERVAALNEQLSGAKERLSDLGRVRIAGMGAMDAQVNKIQDYINALKLQQLTGGKYRAARVSGLPANIAALEKMLEVLNLRKEVEFAPQMRDLEALMAEAPVEMTYAEAAAAILATKTEIAALEGQVTTANLVLETQQKRLEGLQLASSLLSEAIQDVNYQQQEEEKTLREVEAALTDAYTWLIVDRQKFQELGITGQVTAEAMNKAVSTLLSRFAEHATGVEGSTLSSLQQMVKDWNWAKDEILKVYNQIPAMPSGTVPDVPVPMATIPSAAGGGDVLKTGVAVIHQGETIGKGGGDVYITVEGSVVTERQLVDAMHRGLLRKQAQSGSLGWQ